MKKQSVDVLDEADKFDRQMRWIMFQHENLMALSSLKEGWTPGDFLYSYPGVRGSDQVVRPLFELFDFDDMWFAVIEDEDWSYDDGSPLLRERVRCMECDVDWRGEEPCFVCDEDRIDPRPQLTKKKFEEYWDWRIQTDEDLVRALGTPGGFSIGPISTGTHDHEAVYDIGMDPERLESLSRQLSLYASVMREQMGPAIQAAGRSFGALARAFAPHTDAGREFRRYNFTNHRPIRPPAPDGYIRSGGINIPENWELIARISENNIEIDPDLIPGPPLPQRELPPWQRPITEQRRRRS